MYSQYILHMYTYCTYAAILLLVNKKCLCSQLLMEDTQEMMMMMITMAVGLAVTPPAPGVQVCASDAQQRASRTPQRAVSSVRWRSKAAAALPEWDRFCGLPRLPHAASGAAAAWEAGRLLGSPAQAAPSGSPSCQRGSERAARLLAPSLAGPRQRGREVAGCRSEAERDSADGEGPFFPYL